MRSNGGKRGERFKSSSGGGPKTDLNGELGMGVVGPDCGEMGPKKSGGMVGFTDGSQTGLKLEIVSP